MQTACPIIEVLYFAGCPNHEPTVRLVRQVLAELGLNEEIREVPVETAEEAKVNRFIGSPSVRIGGKDIEPEARDRRNFGLSCRMYQGAGVPPKDLLVGEFRTAIEELTGRHWRYE